MKTMILVLAVLVGTASMSQAQLFPRLAAPSNCPGGVCPAPTLRPTAPSGAASTATAPGVTASVSVTAPVFHLHPVQRVRNFVYAVRPGFIFPK